MERLGRFEPELLQTGDWGPDGGYRLMQRLLQQANPPTACFAGSDPMAIGALRALHEAGVPVPDGMALAGFDDIELAAFAQPSLTTVKVYAEQLGRTAVQLLAERLEGREAAMHVMLDPVLVVRESSGAPSKSADGRQ
ncbi:substrate-binding domain-containing protein [Paenibacillus protaetiae]|uniref:Transcriptional regulator LacI/GalR-like sensor domain-containing protein n=1 Tax=Paenibacillus protaetiae TaxID=2509456 RepID=A0A4P6EXA1_9BACL|nr:substrate-binding domain-containing protein [Paenibacillus protaetiae]QAY66853.1 hypothetical protein ET464_11065 [Paenibacillus protaetiae]